MIRRSAPAALCAVLAGALLVACGKGPRPARSAFVAIWVDPEESQPTAEELDRLQAVGASEIFLEAAQLSWQEGAPRITARGAFSCPRRVSTTLVVGGIWAESKGSVRSIARAWRDELAPLWTDLAARSCAPVGVHFEVESASGRERFAEVVGRLRDELPGGLLLSASIDPRTLGAEGTKELAASVDFLVSTVWGQPPGEREDGLRWDLEKSMRPAIAELERLGRPYALAGWTLGSAFRRGAGGSIEAEDETVSVEAAAAAPGGVFRAEALLEGIGRQVNEWTFAAPSIVGSWRLAPGEAVRVVRPATANLEAFLDQSATWGGSYRVGTVIRRLAARNEPLALTVGNMVAALGPGPAEPDLEVSLEDVSTSARPLRIRVVVVNRNDESTDFGGLESNLIELHFDGAAVGRVDRGDFSSWEPLWRGGEKRSVRALREADTLRLHAARIGGRQRIESGPIEIWTRGVDRPRIVARGSFFLPGGRVLDLAERPLATNGGS